MTRKCPDCGFVQPGTRRECGACGASLRPPPPAFRSVGRTVPRGRRDRGSFDPLAVPQVTSMPQILGYAVLTASLMYLGASYAIQPIVRSQIPPTPLHQIIELADLVFHEAGHVIFMLFGNTLHALGGSLMQLLIPSICFAAFVRRYRDPVGAATSLWWVGQNLISMAPYINDARDQRLVLLGGVTGQDAPGVHDWNTILGAFSLLDSDHTLAAVAHGLGSLLIAAACLWSAILVGRAFFAWQTR